LFLTQLMLNASFGLVIGIGLWIIGVPSPALWGILAMVLRFVPYIGPPISAIFPLCSRRQLGPVGDGPMDGCTIFGRRVRCWAGDRAGCGWAQHGPLSSCRSLAAKAQHHSDKVRLLQLADQWRNVIGDSQGPGKKPPAPVAPANDSGNQRTPRSRALSNDALSTPKSPTEQIKKRQGQCGRKGGAGGDRGTH
jgi:hypothetical protein